MKFYILGIVLIISAFFFFYNLDSIPPGLYIDEAMNGLNAQSGEIKSIYPENGGREGLFIILQSLALRITGIAEPWVLRMVSGIIGLIGIVGTFLFLSRLFYRIDTRYRYWWAGIGSFFLSTTVWYSILSRLGFRALLASTILVWTLVVLWYAIRTQRVYLIVLAGIVGGIGMYSYTAYYVSPFILLLFMYLYRDRTETLKELCIKKCIPFILSYVIVSIPLLFSLPSLTRLKEVSVMSVGNSISSVLHNIYLTIGMFFVSGDMNARHNIPGLPHLPVIMMIGVIISFLYYASILIRKKNRSELFSSLTFLFGWIGIGMFPAIFSSEGLPHALRTVLMIIPVICIGTFGIYLLYQWISSHISLFRRVIFTGVILVATLVSQAILLFSVWGTASSTAAAFGSDVVDTAYAIRTIDRNIPVYVVVYRDFNRVYKGVPFPATPIMFLNPQRTIHYVSSVSEDTIPPLGAVFYIGEKDEKHLTE